MVSSIVSSGASSVAADPVRDAIRAASRATGVPFDYLLRTAERESSLDPQARARTSTATGLFQFLDQTWLGVLKEAGSQHGFSREAEAIERRPDGRFVVADPAERNRILALRLDPAANAVMGAEFSRRNTAELSQSLGRAPTHGELYLAHFLGAAGASRFLSQAAETPDQSAAAHFPEAARANTSIFYERGRPRTLAEVRDRLTAPHGPNPTVVAAIEAGSRAEAVPRAPAVDDRRMFHSLFRGEGRGPVSSLVNGMWAGGNVQAFAQPPRAPFFPSAALRVGTSTATAGALGAISAVAPQREAASTPEPVALSFAPDIPLPPDRPAARPQSSAPASVRQTRPLDLLSFTGRQR